MKEKKEGILKQIEKEYKHDLKELKFEDKNMKKLQVDLNGDNDDDDEDEEKEKEKDEKKGEEKDEKKEKEIEGGSGSKDELPIENIIQMESTRLIKKYVLLIRRIIS